MFAEYNFTLGIWYAQQCQPDIRVLDTLILHLYDVVESSVCEHYLELASCEVPSRTGIMPLSKRQELWGGGNNIIFFTILVEPHFHEAEVIKLFRIFICMCHDVLV